MATEKDPQVNCLRCDAPMEAGHFQYPQYVVWASNDLVADNFLGMKAGEGSARAAQNTTLPLQSLRVRRVIRKERGTFDHASEVIGRNPEALMRNPSRCRPAKVGSTIECAY